MATRIFSSDAPILWTRGEGCAELADLLSPIEAVRADGDLVTSCLRARADAVVSRRFSSSFDLVPQIVPEGIDLASSGSITAAVSGGPHSPLAAAVAARLGRATGLATSMVCAYRDEEGQAGALQLIQDLYVQVPDIEYRLLEAADAADLTSQLSEDTALVLGAPGGGWLQRTFFGQGPKLIQTAPAGAIVVRSAPRRVFQEMGEPVYTSPLHYATDLLRIYPQSRLAVTDAGKLVGVVRREALEQAGPGVSVSDLMDEPVSVSVSAALDDVRDVWKDFDPDPVPVVDDVNSLVGGIVLD